MELFDIQVLLQDGSFEDYQVENERENKIYRVLKDTIFLISFTADEDGGWSLAENPGNISEDLQQRILNQLNGFRG